MKALALHTGAPIVHWEDNTIFISSVVDKIVTPRVKHIDILVCFLQEQFDNALFLTKYEKSSVIQVDICTKPCSGQIISRGTKWMAVLILYPTSETEHYQFMRLHEFIVKLNGLSRAYILRISTLT